MNSWSCRVLTLIPHTTGASSLECLKRLCKPRPGCVQKRSFSKQTNHLLICVLQLARRTAPVKCCIIKWKANYAFRWPVSITSNTITSSSAATAGRALVLFNKLLITSFLIPSWHDEVDLLLGSCSAPACLNQSHFSSTVFALTLGSGFPWGQGGHSGSWTNWLRVEETEQRVLRQAEKCMNDCKEESIKPIRTKRKSVSQSQRAFLLSLQRLPDFFSWLLPGHCACPRLWIICFIGSVCLSQRAWLAGWAYAVARELSQSEQGGSFPSVSRQVSRAVDVLAGERESRGGRGGCRVKWSMWLCVRVWERAGVCMCVCELSVHVCERVFILPCLLLSDATSNCVSWATRGPCYVFFFLPVLAGNENQLLCCCHRSGEVCFPSTFIPGTSPSTVTVETRATPTLFPSMSPSFNDLSLLSFFNPLHSAYLPTL